jgi:hypothetical protein
MASIRVFFIALLRLVDAAWRPACYTPRHLAPRRNVGGARGVPWCGLRRQEIAMTDKTKPADTTASTPAAEKHPGMMGDGTEEQNLNQPGNPQARIGKDELQDAFSQKK